MIIAEGITYFFKPKGHVMINISKRYALTFTMLLLTSMNLSAFDQSLVPTDNKNWFDSSFFDGAKDNAKFATWLTAVIVIAYYFLHAPEDRLSNAPFERVLKGFFDNILGDTFNWDNITNFSDIIPGQRWKMYSTLLIGKSDFKVRLLVEGRRKDIKGFGLLHFLEKDMGKIFKLAAAAGVSYAFIMGKLDYTFKQILETILSPYSKATEVFKPKDTGKTVTA